MHYNPFVYPQRERYFEAGKYVDSEYQRRGEKKLAEDFWVKAEKLIVLRFGWLHLVRSPAEEMNFITLFELINASEAREDDEEYQSPVDLHVCRLEEQDPDHFAVKQYRKYKVGGGDVCSK